MAKSIEGKLDADIIIIGAGAAGLFCAGEFQTLKKNKIIILERNKRIAKKVLVSGGGRCNFTNLDVKPEDYVSNNKHFCKSALSQFSHHDFIDLIKEHGVAFYEKKLGQLFCENKSTDIINFLIKRLKKDSVTIKEEYLAENVSKKDGKFFVRTNKGTLTSKYLIIASGGLSFPQLGVSDLGYRVGSKFNHEVTERSASLVPLEYAKLSELSGI